MQTKCAIVESCGIDAGIGESSQSLLRREVAAIGAQGHRWMLVAGCEHRLPVIRVARAQTFDPPVRMAETGGLVGIEAFDQRIEATQDIAQHAIDDAFEARCMKGGGGHRLIDNGVRLLRSAFQSVKRNQQNGVDDTRQRLVDELLQDGVATAEVAQCAVGEILYGTPIELGVDVCTA